MEEILVNKVAESGIITLNLENYLPEDENIAVFDIKPFLFKEMILREKDFRQSLMEQDWELFKSKHVAVTCTTDAIIPMWAYMLIASYLHPFASSIRSGTKAEITSSLILEAISTVPAGDYADKRVVIKGCGDKAMPDAAYIAITQKLRPVVKSLMYGEPCSTVPVYKKK